MRQRGTEIVTDQPRRASASDLRAAVLAWWAEHECDTGSADAGDGYSEEYNIYDEPPLFVQIAQGMAESWTPAQPVEAVDRDAGRDLVKRLRDTPNWMKESFGDWKSATTKYDRAPKEAADYIETLLAALAHPRPTGDVADVPILGWAWLLVDDRTGRDYDSGFSLGHTKPDLSARKGTHYDYRAVITRNRALEATGEINARVRVSGNIFHGPSSDALVDVVDGEEPSGSMVPQVSIRGTGISGHEGLTAPTVEQAGEVVAWLYRSPAQIEFDRKPTLTADAELIRLMRESGDHEIVGLVPAAQPRPVDVPEPLRPGWLNDQVYRDEKYVRGWNDCRKAMLAAAPVSNLETAVGVPDGWKLVPLRITSAICDAMRDHCTEDMEDIWNAAIAAAPALGKGGEA
jgi:hypothetical protein